MVASELAKPVHTKNRKASITDREHLTTTPVTQLRVRPISMADLSDVIDMAKSVGPGFTTLPADEKILENRVRNSCEAFTKTASQIADDVYFMVLEDCHLGKIVGTCAIYAAIGLNKPFYSYKASTLAVNSRALHLNRHLKVLHLVNDYTGSTEIATLYVQPPYRRDRIGQFLSRSRYLLIGQKRKAFADRVMAEIRGWQDEHGNSPFWDNLGKKFFGLHFEDADYLSAVGDNRFIAELMPKYPVYADLLPQAAQDVIGKPHDVSYAAYRLLLREGFHYDHYVDIFDGGPSLHVQTNQIRSIRNLRPVEIAGKISSQEEQTLPRYLLANTDVTKFRAGFSPLRLTDQNRAFLHPDVMSNLGLSVGDEAVVIPFTLPSPPFV